MTSDILLETPRFVLKGITPALIHHLFNTESKDKIIQFFGCDEELFEHFKNMHEKGMETHRLSLLFFLLTSKDTKEPLGDCGFHTWNATHRRAELFYALRKDEFKQKGFMTEAIKPVIKYGFEVMALHRIQAMIADENIPSKKLLENNGFLREGIVREDYVIDGKNEDSVCYSLLKHEWISNQNKI